MWLTLPLPLLANPLGIAIAQIVSPYIVTEVREISLMVTTLLTITCFILSLSLPQLWVYIIPAGVGAILSLCFLYRSSPLTPPTAGGDTPHLPFIKGLISVRMEGGREGERDRKSLTFILSNQCCILYSLLTAHTASN